MVLHSWTHADESLAPQSFALSTWLPSRWLRKWNTALLHLNQVIFVYARLWCPQKPRQSPNPIELLVSARPPLLPGFSIASCWSLISHFKNHPARRDVFPCMWISLTSHSLQHVSHPHWLQICMWRTSGLFIQGTEVVIRWEEHTRKSGGPICLLCDRLDVDRERVWEINAILDPTELNRARIHKRSGLWKLPLPWHRVGRAETMGTVYSLW